ncbi:MAG: recombinase family protein [Bacillus sp. (in: firmicutes)]
MKYGYGRVSTLDQNLDLQIRALKQAGCDEIFTEKESGKKDDRKQLNLLLNKLQPGDELVVYKLDRLGRRATKLFQLVEDLEKQGIEFTSIQDNIDTKSAMGKAMFRIMAVLAEMERDLVAERTVAGLEAARARGKKLGRPPVSPEKVEKAMKLLDSGFSRKETCELMQISRMTLYRYIEAMEDKKIAAD